MTIKYAECHVRFAPDLKVRPTRVREAEARLDLHTEIPVGASALGGKTITLKIKGKHAGELFALIQALREPDADKEELITRLKGLGDLIDKAKDSDSAPDAGENGDGPT